MKDGGSKPNSYSPTFPKGYGKIFIKSEENSEKKFDEATLRDSI
jgi:hypothetical protein